jgi:DNA invertase Pin-like site-specific DNA recombinase
MFADASKRKFDLLLFWALDRFSREGVPATFKYLEKLNACGVDYHSYQQPFLDSCGPLKDVVVAMFAMLAKQERIRISDRTKAGLARAKRAGKVLGRPRVNVDRSEVYRLHREGLSQRAIAAATGLTATTVARALKAA